MLLFIFILFHVITGFSHSTFSLFGNQYLSLSIVRGYFIEVLVAQRSILLNPFSVSFINHLKFGPPIDAGPQKPISEKHLGQQKMILLALPVLIYSEAPHLLHGTGLQIWIAINSQNKGCYRNLMTALMYPASSSYSTLNLQKIKFPLLASSLLIRCSDCC